MGGSPRGSIFGNYCTPYLQLGVAPGFWPLGAMATDSILQGPSAIDRDRCALATGPGRMAMPDSARAAEWPCEAPERRRILDCTDAGNDSESLYTE